VHRIAFIVFSLFSVTIVAFYVTTFFGTVQGEEFAPDTFERREFHYYEVPLLGLQVSPIHRSDGTGDLENYLLGEKILTDESGSKETRWDLVRAHRGLIPDRSRSIAQGDAQILCRYFDAMDGQGEKIWLQWSKKNEALAKVLWPTVAKLARQQLYVFTPDVLAVARDAADAAELEEKIVELLSAKYLDLAVCQQRLGDHELAVELFTESLSYDPDTVAALAGRAKSLSALGSTEQADADVAQAREKERRL